MATATITITSSTAVFYCTYSDRRLMRKWTNPPPTGTKPAAPPNPPKPSICGLTAVHSSDHRLGGWK